ncbi:helix-turn-helix domain-containing protein [uncultured Pseudoalteromonas sp.]|nr:helix-turn-helix domain-containing protein [uncultured Pseudoalteromonas sp.]
MGRPTKATSEKVAELRSQGYSIAKTGLKLGISISSVKRLTAQSKLQ